MWNWIEFTPREKKLYDRKDWTTVYAHVDMERQLAAEVTLRD